MSSFEPSLSSFAPAPTQNNFTLPFTYLGQANYVSHESERPIKMVWRLDHPMPAEMFENCRKGG
jgi:hypothetical protein